MTKAYPLKLNKLLLQPNVMFGSWKEEESREKKSSEEESREKWLFSILFEYFKIK